MNEKTGEGSKETASDNVDLQAVASVNREVSLDLLKSTSAFAVRTPYGQKDPGHIKWDPRNNSFEESQKTIHRLASTDDNLGIHLFGRVVDVDVDTPNPDLLRALDYFLPHTAHVWGRKSRPRSHRLYEVSGYGVDKFDPADYRFLQYLAREENERIKLELRGGDLTSGKYSLLPGSVHPSGEIYEWDSLASARSTPVTVDLQKLMRGVRFACVATMLMPYWTEGQRNGMTMALSGFMHRAVSHMSDLGDKASFIFEKQDAELLLRGICELSGDDEEDLHSRIKTFEKTWEKAEAGSKIKGATALGEMTEDDNLVSLLYVLLIDSPALRDLDDFMERYAVRNNTSNIIDRQRAGHRGAVSIMTMNDFHNSTMHRTIDINGSKVPMSRVVVSSIRATRVEGLAFVPNEPEVIEKDGEKYVNQWRGYRIAPYDGNVTIEDVQPFINYVNLVLACENPRVSEWVLAWIADIFQNPASKSGTALVLVGLPGSGKSFLGEYVLRPIIGYNHSMQTNNIESLTGTFNADSANMLLIQCDEALNSQRRVDANKLKSMITDKTRRIEPKGVNAYQQEDYARYLFTSNERNNAIAITDGQSDRRYSVLDTSDDYSTEGGELSRGEKNKFWKFMHAWAEDEENLAKLHKYLLDMQYNRELIRTPIDTEARRRLQQHSQRGFDDWLMDMANYEHPLDALDDRKKTKYDSYKRKDKAYTPAPNDWPDLIAYKKLKEAYELYRSRRGATASIPTYNEQQIKQEFIARGLLSPDAKSVSVRYERTVFIDGYDEVEVKRIRVTDMPEKDKILKHLERRFGFKITGTEEVSDVSEGGTKKVGGPDF